MKRLNAYLRFNGNCKQAMEFYQKCLGGKLNVMTVGGSPMAAQVKDKNQVIHSALDADGMVLMASDTMGMMELSKGNTCVLCISGDDRKAIEGYFSKLSAGGKVTQALSEMFFGMYGTLTDKFGVDWMFQIDKTPA